MRRRGIAIVGMAMGGDETQAEPLSRSPLPALHNDELSCTGETAACLQMALSRPN